MLDQHKLLDYKILITKLEVMRFNDILKMWLVYITKTDTNGGNKS